MNERQVRRVVHWSALAYGLLAARSVFGVPTDSLSTITTDTGTFAPGNHDFSRFTLPIMCVAAVHQATEVARRSIALQVSLPLLRDTAPERDTLPREAIQLAQRCGTRFTVAAATPNDLPALFTLALQAGNETQARAVVARQLALAHDAKTRQDVLTNAVEGYLAAEPARLTEAAWAAAKADTLALAEHASSLPAHLPLLLAARQAFDQPRMLREAKTVIRLGHTLDFRAIQYGDTPLIAAWSDLMTVTFFTHRDSLTTLAQQAKEDLGRFPLGKDFPPGISYGMGQMFDFANKDVQTVRDFLVSFNPEHYKGRWAIPPVAPSFWFPTKPAAWPPTGHVSLVLYGVVGCAHGNMHELGLGMAHPCTALYTYLREWTERYSAAGFALTIVERTMGEALRSVPLSAQEEADSLNWYYRTYLKLPGTTLGVVPTAVVQQITPEADGRRWMGDTTAFGRYLGDTAWVKSGGLAMLYDRNGQLLYAGPLEYALLNTFIVRELTTLGPTEGGR